MRMKHFIIACALVMIGLHACPHVTKTGNGMEPEPAAPHEAALPSP